MQRHDGRVNMHRPPEGWKAMREQAAQDGRAGYTERGNRKRTTAQAKKHAVKQRAKKAKRAAEQQAKKAKLEEGSSGSDSDSDSSSSSSSSSVKAPEPRAAPYRPLTESDLRAAVQMMRDGKSVPEVQAVVNRWQ